MKARAVSIHSDKLLVQTFIVMSLAFLFSISANAAPLNTTVSKKSVNSKKTNGIQRAATASSLNAQIDPITEVRSLAKKHVDAGVTFVVGTNQSKTAEAKKSYSGSYAIHPGITHAASNTSATASFEYNREYSYELDDHTDGDWSNTLVKVSKKMPIAGMVDNIIIGPRLTIGMGNEARRQTFQGALGAAVAVDKKFGILSITQSTGYTYRQFQYDIRDDGTVNSPHSFDESTSFAVAATKWLELQAMFGLSYIRSFQGVGRTFSTTAVGLNFFINKNVQIGFGATTLRKNTLEPSGRGNRVKFWDSTDAIASVELGLTI